MWCAFRPDLKDTGEKDFSSMFPSSRDHTAIRKKSWG